MQLATNGWDLVSHNRTLGFGFWLWSRVVLPASTGPEWKPSWQKFLGPCNPHGKSRLNSQLLTGIGLATGEGANRKEFSLWLSKKKWTRPMKQKPSSVLWEPADDCMNHLSPWHTHGDLSGVPDSWLQPGSATAVANVWRVNQWMEAVFFLWLLYLPNQ